MLTAEPRATSICARQAEVDALDGRRRGRRPCSSPPPRSAASSPTTRYPAEFLYDNLMIEANVIDAALADRRREAAVPRLVLHLSEARAAADHRGRAADRAARADQRVVRRSPRSPASSCARPIAASMAATSSRPCRPISMARATTSTSNSSHVAAGADPQGARGQDRAATGRWSIWGTGHAAARVPARRRLRRCPRAPDEALFGGRARQRRLGRGPHHRRAGRTVCDAVGFTGAHRARSVASRTARRAS